MPECPDWLRLWYSKPQWRDIRDYTRQLNDKDIRPSQSGTPALGPGPSGSIPSRLALDRVLENKTCSPMSLHDFYMYLLHVEHSAENLEFYLWYKYYELNSVKSTREKIRVSDEISPRPAGHIHARPETSNTPGVPNLSAAVTAKPSMSSISDSLMKAEPPCARVANTGSRWTDNFFRRSPTCSTERTLIDNTAPCAAAGTCPLSPTNDPEKGPVVPLPLVSRLSRAPQAAQAEEGRAELDAAIARFLSPGAEKELNISHSLRQRTLQNLHESSDPRHLKPVADHIYEVMKNCSHRNFVALGVSTGTYETICVGNLIGIGCILGGFLLVLLRALYPHIGTHSRWEVFLSFPLWTLGVTLMLVGTQGMCFLLLSMSKRQALPWERYEDDRVVQTRVTASTGPLRWWRQYRAFMNRTMAHGRNYKVVDKHLRRLQRLILAQCVAGGACAGFCGVLIFVFLPIWKETVHR